MKKLLPFLMLTSLSMAQPSQQAIDAGADESTPSRSQYFSWINNTNEGATEEQTLINLAFFQWLHDEYGMTLDIYAMDAGVLDSKNIYGSLKSDRFKKIFPTGFGNITEAAAKMQTRLGIWGGPDGFGDTPEEAAARMEDIISLCRDHQWALFKFDSVCGPLRLEKEDIFIEMMLKCREYSPDLILLNHRLGLEKSKKHATTFLWEGTETYIDVHLANKTTAPHNRAQALTRGLTPELKRLTEDHGVCISSCIDYWSDDLVLQAFNRSLILAPEIYGNPWLMRDDEYPLLARIYNLHRRFGNILVNGMTLPENYGDFAVARGDEKTRFIALRNVSWEPKEVTVKLGEEIGLAKTGDAVEVRRFHPAESVLGKFAYDDEIKVTVAPFRALLLCVSSTEIPEYAVEGTDYKVIKDVDASNVTINLLGLPGETKSISLPASIANKKVSIDGKSYDFTNGQKHTISFDGEPLKLAYNRFIADAKPCVIPQDAASLYETTIFSTDNNALEVRSLQRSGPTKFKAVQDARDALFNQEAFIGRGIWDKNLFDGNMDTSFWVSSRYGVDQRIDGGCFRLDLGATQEVSKIVIKTKTLKDLEPLLVEEGNYAYVSSDLKSWKKLIFRAHVDCVINVDESVRYVKLPQYPVGMYEIEVYGKDGKKLDSSAFRASNLFAKEVLTQEAYKAEFTLSEVPDGSYLCVALNGKHGKEGAYAALRVDGKIVGAPNRAPSYPVNPWEYVNKNTEENYTYYIPVDASMIGKKLEVVVLNTDFPPPGFVHSAEGEESEMVAPAPVPAHGDLKPKVWMWTSETPYKSKTMTITE